MAGRALSHQVHQALMRRKKQREQWPLRIFAELLSARKEEDARLTSIQDILGDIEDEDNDSSAAVEWACTAMAHLMHTISDASKKRAVNALFKVLERFPGNVKIAREAIKSLRELGKDLLTGYGETKAYSTKRFKAEDDLEILINTLKEQQPDEEDDAATATAKNEVQKVGLAVALELVTYLKNAEHLRLRPAVAVTCIPVLLDGIRKSCSSLKGAEQVEVGLQILEIFSDGDSSDADAHREAIAYAEGEEVISGAKALKQALLDQTNDSSDSHPTGTTPFLQAALETVKRIERIVGDIAARCYKPFKRFRDERGGGQPTTLVVVKKSREDLLQELKEALEMGQQAESRARSAHGQAEDARIALRKEENRGNEAQERANAALKAKELMMGSLDEAQKRLQAVEREAERRLQDVQAKLDDALSATQAFGALSEQLENSTRLLEHGLEGVVLKYGDASTLRRLSPKVIDLIQTAVAEQDFNTVLRCLDEFRSDEVIQAAGLGAFEEMIGLKCGWEGCRVCEQRAQAKKQQAAEQAEIDDRLRQAGATKGAITVSLMWDNDSASEDLDLHVECPQGHISYSNKKVGGGVLDVDNRGSGKAVENIFWAEPEAGTFKVRVENYSKRRATTYTVVVSSECLVTLADGNGQILDNFRGSKAFSGSCLQPAQVCSFVVEDKEARDRREAEHRALEQARARQKTAGVCMVLVVDDVSQSCFQAMSSHPSSLRVQTSGAHLLVCLLGDAASPLSPQSPQALAMTHSPDQLETILCGLRYLERAEGGASATALLDKAMRQGSEHEMLQRLACQLLEMVPAKHGLSDQVTDRYTLPPWAVDVVLDTLKSLPWIAMRFAVVFLGRLCQVEELCRRFCQRGGLELLADLVVRACDERLLNGDENLLREACGILATLLRGCGEDTHTTKALELLRNEQLQAYLFELVGTRRDDQASMALVFMFWIGFAAGSGCFNENLIAQVFHSRRER